MTRELTDHIFNMMADRLFEPSDGELAITVLDEPGSGGASHLYNITGFNSTTNPSDIAKEGDGMECVTVLFQNGTIPEVGAAASRARRNAAGAPAGGHRQEARDQLLRPDRDKLGAGFEQILFAVHAPGDADDSDPAFPGVFHIASSVRDEDEVLS